jgi:hypothetical protein
MRICCTLVFLLQMIYTGAQDVTGIWRGHFRSSNEMYQRLVGDDDRYKMEVQIAQQKKNFKAVTYSYKSTVFYGKADADGSVDTKTKKVLLRELKIVEVRMMSGDACTMTCYLQYSRLGDEEFLEGTYTSNSTRDSTDCGRGTIFLHKVASSDFHKEPFLEKREKEAEHEKKNPPTATAPEVKKNTNPTTTNHPPTALKTTAPKKTSTTNSSSGKPVATTKTNNKPASKPATPQKELSKTNTNQHTIVTTRTDSIQIPDKKTIILPTPKDLATRTNELIKTITVSTPEVQLYIYDDGAIDNDTISVYFDKKQVVSRARLTTQPVIVKLHLDESGENHEVVMVAENLGDIPPNTSLMVVKAGDKRYEVRIVSTEQKNAVVIFRYQKPE